MKLKSGVLALLAIGGIMALSSLVTTWLLRDFSQHHHAADQAPSEAAFHDWLHHHLQLTAEQEIALQGAEAAFESERHRLRAEIDDLSTQLATLLAHEQELTPATSSLLASLGAAQAALQRATLRHYFEMKQHLRPPQLEKLHRWTHDSLIHDH